MKKIKLKDIDNKAPFSVPDGFFSELTDNIQARITEKPKRQWIPVSQLRLALVSSFVLIILAIAIFQQDPAEQSVDEMLAEISEQDLIDYLDMNDFTESELLEGLSEEEIDQLWSDEEGLDDLDLENEDLDELLFDYETDFDKYL